VLIELGQPRPASAGSACSWTRSRRRRR